MSSAVVDPRGRLVAVVAVVASVVRGSGCNLALVCSVAMQGRGLLVVFGGSGIVPWMTILGNTW